MPSVRSLALGAFSGSGLSAPQRWPVSANHVPGDWRNWTRVVANNTQGLPVPSSTVTEQPPSPALLIEPLTMTVVADDAAALPWFTVLVPEFHWSAHSARLGGSEAVTRAMRSPAVKSHVVV